MIRIFYTRWFKSLAPPAPDITPVTFEQIKIETWNFVKAPGRKETTFGKPHFEGINLKRGENPRGYTEVMQGFRITSYLFWKFPIINWLHAFDI